MASRSLNLIIPKKVLCQDLTPNPFKVDHFRAALRISKADKMNRDLMLYLLWQSNLYTNRQIGELFGLSYSSVSRRAAITRKRIQEDSALQKQIQRLNDLINV